MGQMRARNKMFIIEIGPGIPYPKQEERWRRYGEPLSRFFNHFFLGNINFQWFKDGSENFLAGVNVACFESRSKWEESQDALMDFELFAYLFTPINDFFVKLGSWATITGLCNIEDTPMNLAVEAVASRLSGTASVITRQLPVEFDEPDYKRGGHFININERHFMVYIGKQTGYKRFREVSKEQAAEIEWPLPH
jgi:hypothetical protein